MKGHVHSLMELRPHCKDDEVRGMCSGEVDYFGNLKGPRLQVQGNWL